MPLMYSAGPWTQTRHDAFRNIWIKSSVVDDEHGVQEAASLSVTGLGFNNTNLLIKRGTECGVL